MAITTKSKIETARNMAQLSSDISVPQLLSTVNNNSENLYKFIYIEDNIITGSPLQNTNEETNSVPLSSKISITQPLSTVNNNSGNLCKFIYIENGKANL